MLQLAYMWIEDFRTLKDVNLNFHSNFEFEFKPTKWGKVKLSNGEEEESVIEGKLRIKKFNPDDEFIYKYFPENQFISLIVGKNGTGKTSTLELLNTLKDSTQYVALFDIDKESKEIIEKYKIENKFFCVFLDKDNNRLFFWGAIIHKEDKNKIRFVGFNEISEGKEFTLKLPPKEVCSRKSKTNLESIYFSLNNYKIQIHLISKEFKEWHQKPMVGSFGGEEFKSNYLKDNEFFLRNLFKCENINIIGEILSIDKYAKFPDYFIITVPYEKLIKNKKPYDFEKFLGEIKDLQLPEDKKKFIESSMKKLKIFHKFLFKEELEPILRIKAILFIHAFLEYIYGMMKNYNVWKNFIESKEFEIFFEKLEVISELENNAEIKSLIIDLYEHYKSIELRIGRIIYTSIINETLEKIELFLAYLEKLMEENEKIIYRETKNQILIIRAEVNKFKKDSFFLKKIADLVDGYLALKLYNFNPIGLDFYPPLSSGQRALLSVFADVSEVLDGEDCSRKDKEENIILLLDEPDIYFHPEWQRLFIYFLTEFLKKKYQERESPNKKINKKIHTIITTHSPFMLSDVPKGNCVFLDLYVKENENGKVEEYRTIVKPKEEIHNTLAQNIYYLLANGFFMEKGIGEYARRKISEIFNFFYSDKEVDTSYVFKLIDTIGDEVVKNKLKEMFDNIDFYRNIFKKLKEEK